MHARNLLLLVLLAFFAGGCATVTQSEDSARKKAEDWLALIDANKLDAAYAALAPHVRTAVTRSDFEKDFVSRKTYGRPTKRSRDISYATPRLSGHPDGSYMAVTFKSAFERKAEAREAVVLSEVAKGDWRVISWNFN